MRANSSRVSGSIRHISTSDLSVKIRYACTLRSIASRFRSAFRFPSRCVRISGEISRRAFSSSRSCCASASPSLVRAYPPLPASASSVRAYPTLPASSSLPRAYPPLPALSSLVRTEALPSHGVVAGRRSSAGDSGTLDDAPGAVDACAGVSIDDLDD